MNPSAIFKTQQLVPHCHTAKMAQTPLNLILNPQDVVGVLGAQFGGKTTLLQTLSGLIEPFQGTINWLPPNHQKELFEKILYINAETSLLSSLNAIDNLLLPALYHNIAPKKELIAVAKAMLDLILPDLRLQILSPYFSPEIKRKLVIIRALLLNPTVLCLDEFYVGLHPTSIHKIESFLIQHIKSHNMALIVGTQHLPFIKKHATKVIYTSETGLLFFDHSDDFFNSTNQEVIEFLKLAHRTHHAPT